MKLLENFSAVLNEKQKTRIELDFAFPKMLLYKSNTGQYIPLSMDFPWYKLRDFNAPLTPGKDRVGNARSNKLTNV